ncbi:MAG: nitrilase-related carbon-nitrogen hydrolase [Porphyromonas sp.]|nr:nitrilase-related carbon-nitrogen hydrolase [Porphyromonas sp.]
MNQLTVASLQMEQKHKDVDTNVSRLKELVTDGDFDLLVLPEMWTTGFIVDVEGLSPDYLDAAFDKGVATMSQLASRHNAAIYGTLIEPRPSGKPANTGLFLTPDGVAAVYRKKHLFGYGGESKLFEAGDERVQVSYRGWQIRLCTCYDLRFPTWLRQDPSLGLYDLLLCSANWPKPRHIAWERLLRARAIENQCYLAASNRCGVPHPKLTYPGYSFILDAEGDSLAESKEPEERLLTTTLSLDDLHEKRDKFPVLQDLDPFSLL